MQISPELRDILDAMYYDPIATDLLRSTNNKKGDYLSVRNGFITYMPTKKIEDLRDTEDFKPYAPKSRVKAKPAKAAKGFVTGTYNASQYEAFHNLFVSLLMDYKQLRVVRGQEIIDIYKNRYNEKLSGNVNPLGYSCMIQRPDAAYALYVKNPHIVRMITMWEVIKGENTCIARALLWKTSKGVFMDRVYGKDHAAKFLHTYARKHGWGFSGGWGVNRDGYAEQSVMIPLSSFTYDVAKDQWPNLDTFYSNYAMYGQYDGKDLTGTVYFPQKKK